MEMEALRRELVEIIPHTLPYFAGGYQTLMMPAMAGQLAATANSITKFKPAKMVSELPQPKAKVRSAETTRATRNTLRPPSQSAITPVRSFPVIMPAVPQAAISP